ncbi:MAG TPA: HAD-IA family hydrolase [candidate division Zixibacteria bacterium]|nr:HAD-IA family hydrolase [candidate division Zixibacteria bacterium]
MEVAIKGLLFDFDGVISSLMGRMGWPFLWALRKAKPDITRDAVEKVLFKTGEMVLAERKVSPFFAFETMLKIANIEGFNLFRKLQFMIQGGVMYYKSKMNIIPQPQANETLEQLSRKYKLGLVTTAERNVIERAFLKIPSLKKFDIIITREDCKNVKPDPEGIIKGLEGLGLHASQCLYIGDLPSDVLAGKRAKVKVVGILGEFESFSKNHVSLYKPNYVLHWLKDLPDLLRKIDGENF